MDVNLLTSYDSLDDMVHFAARAALTCHANIEKPHYTHDVLKRIIKMGHESVLEHINLTYSIKGLSRACLQELARHRHISLSVESTRHTLRKQLEYTKFFDTLPKEYLDTAFRFCSIADAHPDMPNDQLKYYLPEFWPTNLILTTNVRELRHILTLRTAPEALKEFQLLARSIYSVVPDAFKYLLRDCVHEEAKSWES